MPLEIVCSNCGTTQYSGFDLKPAKDVMRATGNKCKACGKTLLLTDFGIEILRTQ